MKEGSFILELKQRIIDSALHLFDEQGFHRVSVNQIIEDAGTSKGGFYHHFSSKDELLFVIHDTFISYVLKKAQMANEQYQSPTKRLEAIIKDFVSVFDIYKAHLSVFYQESMYLRPEYNLIVKEKRNRFRGIIEDVIHDGKENGDFRSELSVDITTMAILGMVNWTYKWYQRTGEKTIDEIAAIYINIILHAILKTNQLADTLFEDVIINDPSGINGE